MFLYDVATHPIIRGWEFDMRYMLTDRDFPIRRFVEIHPRLLEDRVYLGESIRAYTEAVAGRGHVEHDSALARHNSVVPLLTGGQSTMPIGFTIHGHAVGIGWILALLVLIGCFVLWIAGGTSTLMLLGLIAALALAYLLG